MQYVPEFQRVLGNLSECWVVVARGRSKFRVVITCCGRSPVDLSSETPMLFRLLLCPEYVNFSGISHCVNWKCWRGPAHALQTRAFPAFGVQVLIAALVPRESDVWRCIQRAHSSNTETSSLLWVKAKEVGLRIQECRLRFCNTVAFLVVRVHPVVHRGRRCHND